ncbi:C40 family peptidase [Patulibacter sp.]|uniref:C40 family peptidase n=1 Tax=Patulibacter sp. TaxID=1912859 RepID=UPI00272577FB|nr:NlpC/P60 family protein [Patulibacter sp.]MDO9408818.1 NlpC/P60 family protein [Patulibacter sp.]
MTSGVAVTLMMMLAAAPSAVAQTGGGTSVAPTTTSTTPADPGTGTTQDPSTGTAPAAPATSVSPTKTVKLTRSQTKRVQKRVRVKADGALGARTRTAIKRYQKQRKLTRTGRPNLETIKAMKMPFVAQVEAKLGGTTTSPDADGTATPVATGDVAAAIEAARGVIGTPYASGGNDASGFDCSGLMVYAFKKAGISLPRTSFDQYGEGTAVEKSAIQPGDLVFFSTAGAGASHVGIATSATTVISATTKGVMEHRLDDDYWGAAYVGARRVVAGAETPAPSR